MKLILISLISFLPLVQEKKAESPAKDEVIYTADSIWKSVELPKPGVTLEMPKEPKYVQVKMERVVEGPPIIIHQHKVTVNRNSANFVFVYNDIPAEMSSQAIIKRTLDSAVQGANARVLGKLSKVKGIRHGKFPGREFEYTAELAGTKYRFSAKLVLVGQRLYQLNLVMLDSKFDERMVRKFFDSFKLKKSAIESGNTKSSEQQTKAAPAPKSEGSGSK